MRHETFDESFGFLLEALGKELPKPMVEHYWQAFQGERDSIFCQAVKLGLDKARPGSFPTVAELRGFVADAREAGWQMEKASDNKTPITNWVRSAKAEHARISFDMITRRFLPKDHPNHLILQSQIEEMEGMEASYPGIGWAEAGRELSVWAIRRMRMGVST